MILDRIELADIVSPARLAHAIHDQVRLAPGPVPVGDLAIGLDIAEVRVQHFDGFEGMLLTDRVRSSGVILANMGHGHRRSRFTVAHELGHFLLERHLLTDERGFGCRAPDLRETRPDTLHRRQEREANRFAADLLAPRHFVTPFLSSDPDLRDGQRLRDALAVSLEMAVRRLVDLRPEPLAALWSRNGKVRYLHAGSGCPFVVPGPGQFLREDTSAAVAIAGGKKGFTAASSAPPLAWSDNPRPGGPRADTRRQGRPCRHHASVPPDGGYRRAR